ncbi:uncharacterized protein LOC143534718 [Bidens hawaiensis]|uniref:uncharacterized protein LOC143534718 n=1 Tax=Bidens hawaiensis TaxID=980011 RepID=UPI00404AB3EC
MAALNIGNQTANFATVEDPEEENTAEETVRELQFAYMVFTSPESSENRVIINKSRMKIPYEIVYGHQPTVAHFRAFGCSCTLLNLETTPKFGAAADECYFVGYAGNTAYRVYNKSTKQIIESYEVRWLE